MLEATKKARKTHRRSGQSADESGCEDGNCEQDVKSRALAIAPSPVVSELLEHKSGNKTKGS